MKMLRLIFPALLTVALMASCGEADADTNSEEAATHECTDECEDPCTDATASADDCEKTSGPSNVTALS